MGDVGGVSVADDHYGAWLWSQGDTLGGELDHRLSMLDGRHGVLLADSLLLGAKGDWSPLTHLCVRRLAAVVTAAPPGQELGRVCPRRLPPPRGFLVGRGTGSSPGRQRLRRRVRPGPGRD